MVEKFAQRICGSTPHPVDSSEKQQENGSLIGEISNRRYRIAFILDRLDDAIGRIRDGID